MLLHLQQHFQKNIIFSFFDQKYCVFIKKDLLVKSRSFYVM